MIEKRKIMPSISIILEATLISVLKGILNVCLACLMIQKNLKSTLLTKIKAKAHRT